MGPVDEGRGPDEKVWAPGFGLVFSICLEPWEPTEGHPFRTRH